MHLPDVNVWLALTFDSHVHHPAAKVWFDNLPSGAICFFCRLSQGSPRLATNRAIFGVHALTLAEAWQKYDLILSDPRVAYASEPIGIEPVWRLWTQHQSYSPHVWNDAYLAAFAETATLEVVTFDTGFKQYPGISCTILS